MKRYYFICDNLDDVKSFDRHLNSEGFTTPQIHVLSAKDADVENRDLHNVEAVLKKDVVHSMEVGALLGLAGALLVLAAAYLTDVVASVGWLPFIFLAVVILGFCTWEGGLRGIQEPHVDFKRFQQDLRDGKHILFVDSDPGQESILTRIVGSYPALKAAGTGAATPSWVVRGQERWHKFVDVMP